MCTLGKTWKRKKVVWNKNTKGLQVAWNKGLTGEKSHMSGKKNHQFGKTGKLSPNYGSKRTDGTKKQMSMSAIKSWLTPADRKRRCISMSISNLKTPRGFALKTKYADTNIEKLLEKELLQKGLVKNIDYFKNKNIDNIANVDFHLPKLNIIIEADGCYYHNCPICQKGDHRTFERTEIDKQKTVKLINAGYKVFRFWEHDINVKSKTLINKVLT